MLPIVCSQALDPAVFLGLCDISLSDYHCSSSHGDAIVIISKRWNSAVVCFEDHLDVLASFKFNFQTWYVFAGLTLALLVRMMFMAQPN